LVFATQTKSLITDFQQIYFKDSPKFRALAAQLPVTAYLYFTEISCMAKFDANSTLKRLQNRYRLVVMNDDTYEEVVTFKLSRLSVYIFLSTIFVLLTGLTVALIVFTPLRMYIPGYGDVNATRELRDLKIKTDSLEQAMIYKDRYLENVKNVLQGNANVNLDTTMLSIPATENIDD
jgi:hypothetical protein